MKPFRQAIAGCIAALTVLTVGALGYETNTHSALSYVAITRDDCVVSSANTNPFLENELLIKDGIATPVTDGETRTLVGWTQRGSVLEDGEFFLSPRPRNHFYNPLTQGGLNDIFSGKPSPDWAWSDSDNDWSWTKAREYYLNWLTSEDPDDREQYAARTFRALGQVVHLVQDAAQPQHTRNDAHIRILGFIGPGSPYETFCSDNYNTNASITNLVQASIPSFSTLEFRSFWDTGQYRAAIQNGGTIPAGGFASTLGMAEYSNAYFVTDDTMFTGDTVLYYHRPDGKVQKLSLTGSVPAKHRFPYPRLIDTGIISWIPSSTSVTLTRAGDSIDTTPSNVNFDLKFPGGISSLFTANSVKTSGQIGLTSDNWNAHARDLLPKAVSYSTGLINYFFRARIDAKLRWDKDKQQNVITITNNSPEVLQNGQWSLYLDDKDNNREPVPLTINNNSLAVGASVDATFDEQLCDGGGTYTLVFQGTMGNESSIAIAAKRFKGSKDEVWEGTYSVDFPNCVPEDGDMTITFHRSDTDITATVHWVSDQRDASVDVPVMCSGTSVDVGGSILYGIHLDLSGASLDGYETWRCPADVTQPGIFGNFPVELTREE